MDFEDYEAVGTFRNALSMHCEEVYLEASADHRRKLSSECLRRSHTDTFSDPRGVRRPTCVQDLSVLCEVPENEVVRIVEVFGN